MSRAILKIIVVCLLMALILPAAFAQEPAEIQNDEGGVQTLVGQFEYSDPQLPERGSQPVVFLGDVSQVFVEDGFEFSTEYVDVTSPQFLGTITDDVSENPFHYVLALPINPGGKVHDVDNDAEAETGVMVYTVNFTYNMIGDAFIDHREYVSYSSISYHPESDKVFQFNGGTLVVYSPEAGQGFPAGFGEDELVFTEDDPIVEIPQGWTVVYMNPDGFVFDRSQEAQVDIIESEATDTPDFSAMTYTEAFDAMIEMMRQEYAFTELKGVDWDAKIAEFRPRFAEAEANEDAEAYYLAFRDFTWSIPDVHIGSNVLDPLNDMFLTETAGGLGMAIRETDDGRVITNFILDEGPAAVAGIEIGAQILEINGAPIADAVSANVPWSAPFSTPAYERLQQLRYVLRFPVDTEVEITYQNPGDTEPTTATLKAIGERQSFSFSSFNRGLTGNELPVEFRILDSGYGYIKIYSFFDDPLLTLTLWERAIDTMNANEVPGIVLDLRQNGGGTDAVGEAMAAYFLDEPLYVGTSAFYAPDIDDFVFDAKYDSTIIPADEGKRYHGELAILITPSCVSMCEFFSYSLALNERAAIVGQYPTAGGGGSIQTFSMPGDIFAQFTTGRAVGTDNEIHIEGVGVVPTVVVPVNEETLFSEGDPILETAEAWLDEATSAEVIEGGSIAIGDSITGEITEGQRVRYTLDIKPGDSFSIYLEDAEQALDTYLWLYAGGSEEPVIENDDFEGTAPNSAIEGLTGDVEETIIIEVGTFEDSSAGTYTLRIVDLNAATEATAEPEATAEATPGS